jgi:hypothetical protein
MKSKSKMDKMLKNSKLKELFNKHNQGKTQTIVSQGSPEFERQPSRMKTRIVGKLPVVTSEKKIKAKPFIKHQSQVIQFPNFTKAVNKTTHGSKSKEKNKFNIDDYLNYKFEKKFRKLDSIPLSHRLGSGDLSKKLSSFANSLNSSKNKIFINQSNLSFINTIDNGTTVPPNNNIINIVNNVNDPINDILKVKINSYDINYILPSNEYIMPSNEENDFKSIEDSYNKANQMDDKSTIPIDERNNLENENENILNSELKQLRSSKTFNVEPKKIQIDITHKPISKTLSLKINNVNHNILYGERKTVQTNPNDQSGETLKLFNKQFTREMSFGRSFHTLENNSGNSSPVRISNLVRTNSIIDSDSNNRMKKVSLYLTSNIEEVDGSDIFNKSEESVAAEDEKLSIQGDIYLKLTPKSKDSETNKLKLNNSLLDSNLEVKEAPQDQINETMEANVIHINQIGQVEERSLSDSEQSDFDSDYNYELVRKTVKRIIAKVGAGQEDIDLALKESKLHSSNFIREVNRTATMLRLIKEKGNELRSQTKGKSVIVKRSNILEALNELKRANSALARRLLKGSKMDLQSIINNVVIDQALDYKFLDFQNLKNIEFKLLEIATARDGIVKESKNSSLWYIKDLIDIEFQQKSKLAKNRKLLGFYKTGFKRRLNSDLLITYQMIPFIKPVELNIDDIQSITTGVSVSQHICRTYLDAYNELLLSIFRNYNNYSQELGEKPGSYSVFETFKINSTTRRTEKGLSVPFFKHFEYRKQNSSIKIRNPSFLGPENNEFVNRCVIKDNPNDKGDEDSFLHPLTDSEDEGVLLRKLTYQNIKSDFFYADYLKEAQRNKNIQGKRTKKPRIGGEEDDTIMELKPKRVRKAEFNNKSRGSYVTKMKFKKDKKDENKLDGVYVLRRVEDANYVISNRQKHETYIII